MRCSRVGEILDGVMESKEINNDLRLIESIFDEGYGMDISILGEEVEFEPLFSEDKYYEEINKLDEAKAVTFGGEMFPKFGWALVLSGGAGSGKGYSIENNVALDAKIMDVDKLKELYVSVLKSGKEGSKIKSGDSRMYDMGNPDDVQSLHFKIEDKGYNQTMKNSFFRSSQIGRLPNVIIDTTGKSESSLIDHGKLLRKMGYRTSLVWVVTNREMAILRNLSRSRVVPQEVLHDTHNKVNNTVFPFLESGKADDYDEAWVIFSSLDSAKEFISSKEAKEFAQMSVVRLIKRGSKFVIPEEVYSRVRRVLGENEPDPMNPKVYKDFDSIKKEMEPYKVTKSSNSNYKGEEKISTKYKGYGDISLLSGK